MKYETREVKKKRMTNEGKSEEEKDEKRKE